MELKENYLNFYRTIDENAKKIAEKFLRGEKVTQSILKTIYELYLAVRSSESFKDNYFDTAYHEQVTPYLEFFIGRILYHFSKMKKLGWKIYLRRQVGKKPNRVVPDIRIEKSGKSIGVIDIKAKVGWKQQIFSEKRYKKYRKKGERLIKLIRKQIKKYKNQFGIDENKIFLLIPTLKEAHKNKHKESFKDHIRWTGKVTGLKEENIIVLSKNLKLDLDNDKILENFQPTKRFENMIKKLEKFT